MCVEFYMNTPKYIQDAFNNVVETLEPAIKAAKPLCKEIAKQYNILEAQVERWTEANLPKPINKIATQALRALPPALAFIFLPSSITVPLVIGIGIIQIVQPKLLPPKINAALLNGLALSGVKDAIADTAQFITTLKGSAIFAAVLNTLTAVFLVIQAQDFEKKAEAPIVL